MNFRDRLKRKAIKTKDPFQIRNQFRKVKNEVNREINSAKKGIKKCLQQLLPVGIKGKLGRKTTNELTSRTSNKTVINEMEYNGVNSGDQIDIAEMLNSFFTEIGPSLGRDLTEVEEFLPQ